MLLVCILYTTITNKFQHKNVQGLVAPTKKENNDQKYEIQENIHQSQYTATLPRIKL